MSEWISVEDELPEKSGIYLCYFGNGNGGFSKMLSVSYQGVWHSGYQEPTHWQHLPAPPVEETV